jgi:hypothetical protein
VNAHDVVSRGVKHQVKTAIAPIYEGLINLCETQPDKEEIPIFFRRLIAEVIVELEKEHTPRPRKPIGFGS